MDTLFENYELFIREHSEELGTPSGAVRMLNDEGMFRAYTDSLTEGLEPHIRANVLAVLGRERDMLLTESANVPSSGFATGLTL